MNVPKIMARLNAPSVQYGASRGGIPEITTQDIAGALADISDPLARDVLCAIWWPDGASRTKVPVETAIRDLILREFSARCRALHAAKLRLQNVEANYFAKRAPNSEDQVELSRAQSAVESSKAAAWPSVMKKYAKIVNAVLTEVSFPRHCAACAGKGFRVKSEGLKVDCEKCGGYGERGESKTWRAKQLDVSEQNFHRHWQPVYDWTYSLVVGLERTAAQQLRAAIYGAEDEAA